MKNKNIYILAASILCPFLGILWYEVTQNNFYSYGWTLIIIPVFVFLAIGTALSVISISKNKNMTMVVSVLSLILNVLGFIALLLLVSLLFSIGSVFSSNPF